MLYSGRVTPIRSRLRLAAGLAALALPLACPGRTAAAQPVTLALGDGLVTCRILSDSGPVPELVLSVLPVAVKSAMEQAGPPPAPAALTLRLQKPPPFYKRFFGLVRADALATQQGDEILLQPGHDPLKLAFRLGHELSHWLVRLRHPVRPPLWLDEGLANRTGAAAAEAAGRPRQIAVERPLPPRLARHPFTLNELVALKTYPVRPAETGAFYWQAEALVDGLHRKLGKDAFLNYLALLCVPEPPAWDAPLRERWYFNDADFRFLARQIHPETRPPPSP